LSDPQLNEKAQVNSQATATLVRKSLADLLWRRFGTAKLSNLGECRGGKMDIVTRRLMVAILSSMLLPTPADASAWIKGLGYFHGYNYESTARAVSSDGKVIAGQSMRQTSIPNLYSPIAVRWVVSNEGVIDMTKVCNAGDDSTANAMSADGQVVVGRLGFSAYACRMRSQSESEQYQLVLPNGKSAYEAVDLTADGRQILVTSSDGHYFVLPADQNLAESYIELDQSDAQIAGAEAISPDGKVVVGWIRMDFQDKAARWVLTTGTTNAAERRILGNGMALDVSAAGKFTVGGTDIWGDGLAVGWIDERSARVVIGGGILGAATAVSGNGKVICINTDSGIYFWREGFKEAVPLVDYLRRLGVDTSLWKRLDEVTDISEDGRFLVGSAVKGDGSREAILIYAGE
jgi:uncharacterized membrane protein